MWTVTAPSDRKLYLTYRAVSLVLRGHVHRRDAATCPMIFARVCGNEYRRDRVMGEEAMSIYQGARRRLEDIHATAARAPSACDDENSFEEQPFIHMRRARPSTVLLPRTSLWLSEIPEPFRPSALAAQFPRVANTLCACWADPVARGLYLQDLLTGGGRPRRKGFPSAVVRELQRIHAVHTTLCGMGRSLWDDPLIGDAERR